MPDADSVPAAPEISQDFVDRYPFFLRPAVRRVVAIGFALGCIAWLLRLVIYPGADPLAWTTQIVIAMASLLIWWWGVIVRRRHWSVPTRRLCQFIQEARNGQISIEHLGALQGGIQPLIPSIQQLLRDLKQQRADMAALNDEIRLRVAGRTDALERKIGSLQMQAMRDLLSGLNNRRALDQELPRMIESHRADGQDMCLLMMDVDYFKQLNDSLGHAAGDQLLRELGQIIRSTLRQDDLAFRCGGDEFVVLLNQCGAAGGQSIADRLTSLADGLARPLRIAWPLGLSIGICALSDLAEPNPQSMLEVADKRLYAAKAAQAKLPQRPPRRLKHHHGGTDRSPGPHPNESPTPCRPALRSGPPCEQPHNTSTLKSFAKVKRLAL